MADAESIQRPPVDSDASARAQDLLNQLGESAPAELVWDLRFQLEILSESLKEHQARSLGLEEENEQLRARVTRERSDYVALRASMDELLNLHELTEKISTSFAIADILEALMDLSARFLPSQSSAVFSFSEGDSSLSVLLTRGGERVVECVRDQINDGIIDWVLREQHPVVVEDMQTVEQEEVTVCSVVLVPLRVRGKDVGLYALYCGRPKDAFTAGEMELLSVLANQTAIALENARLYSALEASNTQLKDSQQQLIMAEKMAALGRLAGGVAHEVNNPLQIILSRVQLMRMNGEVPERLLAGLDSVEHNVRRITKIIRGLLDMAGHRAAESEWRSCDVGHALQQTIDLVRPQLEQAKIELVVNCPGDLPQIVGNIGELEQVFLNLMINAQNAMTDGGLLQVIAGIEGARLFVRFVDTGVGIPDAVLDQIFDPFFTTRSDQGGTGLGLAVSYGIVERHGGTISVESECGKGTSFELHFPIAVGEAQ